MIRVSTVRLKGGQGDRISSGFEPTKALVRGYRYPTAVLPRLTDSQDPTSHTTYLQWGLGTSRIPPVGLAAGSKA